MAYLEELKEITAWYLDAAEKVFQDAPPLAGIFGIGKGPKSDPVHMQYYNKILEKVQELNADESVSEQETFDCAEYLIKLDDSTKTGQMMQYMLMTVQGCAKEIVPKLSDEHRHSLAEWFAEKVPRRMRLPVQDQLFKLLKK